MCQLLNVSLILVWICDGDILTIFSLFFSQLRADVVPKTAGEECWLCVYVCVLVRHARVCMRVYACVCVVQCMCFVRRTEGPTNYSTDSTMCTCVFRNVESKNRTKYGTGRVSFCFWSCVVCHIWSWSVLHMSKHKSTVHSLSGFSEVRK